MVANVRNGILCPPITVGGNSRDRQARFLAIEPAKTVPATLVTEHFATRNRQCAHGLRIGLVCRLLGHKLLGLHVDSRCFMPYLLHILDIRAWIHVRAAIGSAFSSEFQDA